jgi:hypothetical protein
MGWLQFDHDLACHSIDFNDELDDRVGPTHVGSGEWIAKDTEVRSDLGEFVSLAVNVQPATGTRRIAIRRLVFEHERTPKSNDGDRERQRPNKGGRFLQDGKSGT